VTSHLYWPRRGPPLRWKKTEVSLYHKRIFKVSFFSVGRIIHGDNTLLTRPVTTLPHLRLSRTEQGTWQSAFPLSVNGLSIQFWNLSPQLDVPMIPSNLVQEIHDSGRASTQFCMQKTALDRPSALFTRCAESPQEEPQKVATKPPKEQQPEP